MNVRREPEMVRWIVTRPANQVRGLTECLAAGGWHYEVLPLIEVVERTSDEIRKAVSQLADYDAILFTSANAVRAMSHAFSRIASGWPPCYAVGRVTKQSLGELGVVAASPPNGKTSGDLARWLLASPSFRVPRRVLLPQGQLAGTQLADVLTDKGHRVTTLTCYDTVEAPVRRSDWERVLASARDDMTVIPLYSPSAARALHRHYIDILESKWDSLCLAAIGPTTSTAMRQLGLPVQVVSSSPRDEVLVREALQWIYNRV